MGMMNGLSAILKILPGEHHEAPYSMYNVSGLAH